ncbi:maleylpyruvate isomerase N-terminal domain-containing protein, partial [Nonomuraea lactucae]|uniref:maleylpyruvate isomerase N-terminal domain-containing protein n=1 Tax=Nonomuraea lactucae TaxID=2249762 RepID=UPI001962F489
RLAAAADAMPAQAWSARVVGLRPPPHPAWYVLVRRLREVGMHHVDLDAGYGPAGWPERFVLRELHDCLRTWPYEESTVGEISLLAGSAVTVTTWKDLGRGPAVAGRPADVLAWLTGRSRGEGIRVVREGRKSAPGPGVGVPAAPPWLTMPAPADLPATPPEDYP